MPTVETAIKPVDKPLNEGSAALPLASPPETPADGLTDQLPAREPALHAREPASPHAREPAPPLPTTPASVVAAPQPEAPLPHACQRGGRPCTYLSASRSACPRPCARLST